MIDSTISILPNDAGGWVGLIGGVLGLVTFGLSLWRRRVRVVVDYAVGNDAHDEWHEFTVTNRSDLPVTFRYIGPAWYLPTLLLPYWLNSAIDDDDGSGWPIVTLQARESKCFSIMHDYWSVAWPKDRAKKAYLKVGFEFPVLGKTKWIRPRRSANWDRSVRERLIEHLYRLKTHNPL